MEKRKVVRKVRMMYRSTRPSQGRYGFFSSGSRAGPSSSELGSSGSANSSVCSVRGFCWSSSSEWGVVLIANAGRGALEAVVELAHHLVLPFGEVTLKDMLTSLADKAQVEGQIVDRSDLKA